MCKVLRVCEYFHVCKSSHSNIINARMTVMHSAVALVRAVPVNTASAATTINSCYIIMKKAYSFRHYLPSFLIAFYIINALQAEFLNSHTMHLNIMTEHFIIWLLSNIQKAQFLNITNSSATSNSSSGSISGQMWYSSAMKHLFWFVRHGWKHFQSIHLGLSCSYHLKELKRIRHADIRYAQWKVPNMCITHFICKWKDSWKTARGLATFQRDIV